MAIEIVYLIHDYYIIVVCFWYTIIIIIIIILSCVIPVDSSQPMPKRISVSHGGLSTPIDCFISRNNSSRKEDAWTRNEVHWRITDTPKRGVTPRDWSLGRDQKKSCEETGDGENLIMYNNNNNQNALVLYKRLRDGKSTMKSNYQTIKWTWTIEKWKIIHPPP